jgi:hypothetical protein
MTDMEMIFLKGSIGEETDLNFLKKKEDDTMLIEICNRIADSVTADEYNYWCARREQFFEEGAAAVEATISDDIAENLYPEETFPWNGSEV